MFFNLLIAKCKRQSLPITDVVQFSHEGPTVDANALLTLCVLNRYATFHPLS